MADSSVAITAGSGTPIRVLTGLGAGSADQQVVTLADSAGNLLGTTSAGLPVQITGATDPDTTTTGTISATDAVVAAPAGDGTALTGTPTAGSTISLTAPGGDSTWDAQLTGTFGGGTVYFEGSFDGGTNWLPLNGRQTGIINTVLGFSTTTAGVWRGNTSGVTNLRVRMRGATAPSVAVTLRIASGVGAVFLNASVPAGTNYIGQTRLTDGTNNPAVKAPNTQAVSADPALVVALSPITPTPAGTNAIGTVKVTDWTDISLGPGTISATDAVVAAPAGLGALVTGTPTASSSYSFTTLLGHASTVDVTLNGTFGGGTVWFEGSPDVGTSQISLPALQIGVAAAPTVIGTSAAGSFRINAAGMTLVRARMTGATTPSVTVFWKASAAQNSVSVFGSVALQPSTTIVSATAAAATAVTATLTAPGVGLYHYITAVRFERFMTAAGTAAGTSVVTGGANHSLVFQLPTDAAAQGTQSVPVDFHPTTPLKVAAANTATTFTTPVVTATIYRITVTYYTGA